MLRTSGVCWPTFVYYRTNSSAIILASPRRNAFLISLPWSVCSAILAVASLCVSNRPQKRSKLVALCAVLSGDAVRRREDRACPDHLFQRGTNHPGQRQLPGSVCAWRMTLQVSHPLNSSLVFKAEAK